MDEFSPRHLIVTGTDTGIGKTVLSAMLVLGLDASYWKPVQSGLDGETDSECVRRLTGVASGRIIPEAYRLTLPRSPDQSARHDGIMIDPDLLRLPDAPGTVIIEGAGGLMVPLSDELLQIDLFARWHAPLVLAARTGLGTLNHTLLSVESLRARNMPLLGIILIGPEHPGNVRSLERWSNAPVLATIPHLERLDRRELGEVQTSRLNVKNWGAVS